MLKTPWRIRDAIEDDLNLVYPTWGKSYRYGSALGRSCGSEVFFPYYTQVIKGILSDPTTRTLMACLMDEPHVILGYLVYQPEIVHYCYVKRAFQRHGIARSLIHCAGKVKFYTHDTDLILRNPLFEGWKYNPLLLFKGVVHGTEGESISESSASLCGSGSDRI